MKVLLLLTYLANIDFVVENRVPPNFAVENKTSLPDPYGYTDYAKFHTFIKNGGYGILVVGLKDQYVGSQYPHCRVEKGFGKLEDGDYECYMIGETPMMVRIIPVALKLTPRLPVENCGPTG